MNNYHNLFLVTLFGVFYASSSAAQTIYENNFDQHTEPEIYTIDDLNQDWNTPIWDNGVTEGRVSIVEGEQAYGGEGSALAVLYPANGVGPLQTGTQWKFDFDAGYEELVLSYKIKFQAEFNFVNGGKLPGLAGGSAPTGSAHAIDDNGWSGRMMWRAGGTAISYAKYLESGTSMDGTLADQAYFVKEDGEDFTFAPGVWYQITQRIKMNTPGASEADGVIQLFVDDQLLLNQENIRFRDGDELQIDKMYFSTFFGGATARWAPSKDEYIYFDEFRIAVPTVEEEEPTISLEPRCLKVPSAYATIEDALTEAMPGDTVAVTGDYTTNVVIDKSINFHGCSGTSITAADPLLPAIAVTASNVLLKRLKIKGGGVVINAGKTDVELEDIDVTGAEDAITIGSGCHNCTVKKCDLSENSGVGIKVTGCDDLNLTKIFASNNGCAGFAITDAQRLILYQNKAYDNEGIGFEFLAVDNSRMEKNYAKSNGGDGFEWSLSSDNLIRRNRSRKNDGYGYIAYGSGNQFYRNYSRSNIFGRHRIEN